MAEPADGEKRLGCGGGWRGLCGGSGLQCAARFPEAGAFPRRILADSKRGRQETCAAAPAPEVPARWRDCVQGHASTAAAATSGRQWREIVLKEGPDGPTQPPSLEREQEGCQRQDLEVQSPIEVLFPEGSNATSPASSKRAVTRRAADDFTGNSLCVTDTSSITRQQAVEQPHVVPLSTDYCSKRPAHDYPRAVQQNVRPNAHPFGYKRDPYVAGGAVGTNVYPYTANDGAVTTAVESHTVPWDNCNARLHGVHSLCDLPVGHEKNASSPEADLDMESYIAHVKSTMRDMMPSVEFQHLQRSRSQSPNAVSSHSLSLSASPQRSDSGMSDSSPRTHRREAWSSSWSSFSKSMKANNCVSDTKSAESTNKTEQYLLPSTLEQIDKQLRSSAHKRCSSQSSLSSRSRSQSPLAHVSQSRNNHLLKRKRNSPHSSRSRNRSPSIHSSRSRSQSPRKNDRRLHRSSVSRKCSPSSKTSQSSSASSYSSRTAHHSPRLRSRKHYTSSRTSQSSRSLRSRGSRSSRSRGSRSSRSRSSRSSRSRGSRSSRSRSSRSSRSRSSRSSRSRSSRSSQSRSSRSSRSRSLTPRWKGTHSSQIQKSPSTSTHPLGSSESSDEDTTQRNFGVKVQFYKGGLDNKSAKKQIFQLFHKFGFVTHVKIIHSGSERFAVVYFSRLYEQLAAFYNSSNILICNTPVKVSLWTGKEKEEQHKPDNTAPEATQAKFQEIKSVSGNCDHNIFMENDIALHPSSSRTLLISKLPKTIAPAKLDMICLKFETIVDIEVEQTPGESTCSALIEFTDIVSLVKAGKVLNRKYFGIDGVILGFAEMKPTNCLWVDGLPPTLSKAKLMEHFATYGPVAKMLHDPLRCRALILYQQREDALFAVKQTKLRQVQVFGSWLMLDFASDRSQLAFCQSMQESGQDVGNFLHE